MKIQFIETVSLVLLTKYNKTTDELIKEIRQVFTKNSIHEVKVIEEGFCYIDVELENGLRAVSIPKTLIKILD